MISKFLEYSKKNIHYGNDLSKVTLVALQLSLSAMCTFRVIFQEFKKNSL